MKRNRATLFLIFFASILPGIFHLNNSLWLDESVTAWVVKDDFKSVIDRSYHFQQQHPVFFCLTWLSVQIFGFNELALRIFPLAFFGLSVSLLYLIALKRIGHFAALISALSLAADFSFRSHSAEARSYSIATFFCFLGVYFCTQNQSNQAFNQRTLLSMISIVIAFYFHYYFILAGIIPLYFSFKSIIHDSNRKSISSVSLFRTLIICSVLIAPTLPHLLEVSRRRNVLLLGMPPGFSSVLEILASYHLIISLILTAPLIVYLSRKTRIKEQPNFTNRKVHLEHLAWMISAPTISSFLSYANIGPLLLNRYILWYTGGTALVIGSLFYMLPASKIRHFAFGIYLPILFVSFYINPFMAEDWKGLSQTLNLETPGENSSLFLFTGFVESRSPSWQKLIGANDYQNSVFAMYPIKFPISNLPYSLYNPESSEQFETKLLSSDLRNSFLALRPSSDIDILAWFEQRGVKPVEAGAYGYLKLFRLTKSD